MGMYQRMGQRRKPNKGRTVDGEREGGKREVGERRDILVIGRGNHHTKDR